MRDRDLVRLYWPGELRSAFDALFDIDDAMSDVVARSTEPALAEIKLAWWREALERLDSVAPPPEPRLQAVAQVLLPRGITGAQLARLEDGWVTLLDPEPDSKRAGERGDCLFAIAARLLGASDQLLGAAGRLYGYVSASRIVPHIRLVPMEEFRGLARHRFPRALRPLTGLARLAARDVGKGSALEAEASPARALALLSHWVGGRVC